MFQSSIGNLFVYLCWIIAFSYGSGVANGQSGSDLSKLKSLVSRTNHSWPEGKLKCTVRSAFGSTVVSACWAGETVRLDHSRLTFADNAPDAGEGHEFDLISMRNRRWAFFCDKRNEIAVLKRSSDADAPSQPLRVLPTEIWNEITPGQTILQWLNAQSNDAETNIECRSIERGRWELTLSGKEESTFRVLFTKHGLLESAQTLSALPEQGRLHIDVTWDESFNPPRPLRYVKRIQASERSKREIMLQMEIEAFENRVDGVDFSFPPKDLPFGIRVTDERGAIRRESFVGGELGKQQFLMKRMAKQMRGTQVNDR
ncbi:hypothetical protein [Planctomycetes bacterium TBK1r]